MKSRQSKHKVRKMPTMSRKQYEVRLAEAQKWMLERGWGMWQRAEMAKHFGVSTRTADNYRHDVVELLKEGPRVPPEERRLEFVAQVAEFYASARSRGAYTAAGSALRLLADVEGMAVQRIEHSGTLVQVIKPSEDV